MDNNKMNPSKDVKAALQDFNDDFNNRCMQDDTIKYNYCQLEDWIKEHLNPSVENNEYLTKKGYDEMSINKENRKVLEEIKEDVIRFGMANMYNFSESESIREDYKKAIDDMLMSYSKDPVVTESINHTGFPDDITVMLIELNTGYKVNSIKDFSSVKTVWHNDKYKIGYIFELELACSSISVNVDINTEEGSDKCE